MNNTIEREAKESLEAEIARLQESLAHWIETAGKLEAGEQQALAEVAQRQRKSRKR